MFGFFAKSKTNFFVSILDVMSHPMILLHFLPTIVFAFLVLLNHFSILSKKLLTFTILASLEEREERRGVCYNANFQTFKAVAISRINQFFIHHLKIINHHAFGL
jgi:hypothetical protein